MNATVGSSAANVKSERHKVPFLAEILDGAKQFGSAHQYILQYMLKYGQVTQKRFYIEFINYYVTMLLDRDEHVVSRIDATLPQLVKLVSTILESCNEKAQKIGIQLAQARREVDDQQVVSIITQKGFSPPLADRYGASQDEKVFLSRMVGEFAQSNGRLTKEAMNELRRYLPNLNSAKFEKILNKLLDQQWISETDEHYYLEPRSIAELGPLLRAKYNTPTCVFCQVLILDRDEAGFCEKCDINAHSFCIDKLAKDGELNCPLACGSKFTRGERTTPIEKSSSSTEQQRAIKRENEDIEMMEPSTSKRPVIREIQDTGVNVGRKQKPA